MSVIEQAAKRLEELRRIQGGSAPANFDEFVEHSKSSLGTSSGDGKAYRLPTLEGPEEFILTTGTNANQIGGGRGNVLSIDLVRLAGMGFVAPQDPRSTIAEEFRAIKRPLIRNAFGKAASPIPNGNLIMITSALPGEGKSTTAINLALSIAMEIDSTVLLVDADVARPAVPGLLNISSARGLLDVLVDERLDMSEVMAKTNIEKLGILTCGEQRSRATELLASSAMSRLLSEMSRRYSDRMIIFDSPPLLLSNEARVLAAQMGQIVVVVEAERTTHSALRDALATIETCPVKLLVLNKSRVANSGGSYGYGYGYSYGNGFEDRRT